MIDTLLSQLDNGVSALQTLLFIDVIQPLFYRFGLMGYDEDTYDALYWVIVGVLQIGAMYALLRPLEALRPAESWRGRGALRADIVYTWIAKLGILNFGFFFLLQPVFNHWQSLMAIHNVPQFEVDALWPGVTDRPVDLVAEHVDCVIRAGAVTDQSLIVRRIADLHFVSCATPDYLARSGEPAHPAELESGHTVIGYFSSSPRPFPFAGRKRLCAPSDCAASQEYRCWMGMIWQAVIAMPQTRYKGPVRDQ